MRHSSHRSPTAKTLPLLLSPRFSPLFSRLTSSQAGGCLWRCLVRYCAANLCTDAQLFAYAADAVRAACLHLISGVYFSVSYCIVQRHHSHPRIQRADERWTLQHRTKQLHRSNNAAAAALPHQQHRSSCIALAAPHKQRRTSSIGAKAADYGQRTSSGR
mgnify:CR=1 FL=1